MRLCIWKIIPPKQKQSSSENVQTHSIFGRTAWNSCPEVFFEKAILWNFLKFIGKHLCWSLILKKIVAGQAWNCIKKGLQLRCFLLNFNKISQNAFFIEHLETNAAELLFFLEANLFSLCFFLILIMNFTIILNERFRNLKKAIYLECPQTAPDSFASNNWKQDLTAVQGVLPKP